MGTITGYIRCSTAKQNNEHWKLMLEDYARSREFNITSWEEETVSGAKSWKNRKLSKILKSANPGDILIVGEASRIGRDSADAQDFVKEAKKIGLIIHIVQASLILDETEQSMNNELILGMLFTIAQFERKLLSYRTKSGLKRARAEGKTLGGYRRKGVKVADMESGDNGGRSGGRSIHPQRSAILRAVTSGNSISGTADRYKVSRITIHRWMKEEGLK